MHHDQSRKAAGREQHDRHEKQAEIELPCRGVVAQAHLQPGDRDRAEDGTDIVGLAADVDHQQNDAGTGRAHRIHRHDLVIDCMQSARKTRKRRGDGKYDEPHALRVVTDERGALRIVPDGVAHASYRCARERIHQPRRDNCPEYDDVVDLQLRGEIESEHVRAGGAVGGETFLASGQASQHP